MDSTKALPPSSRLSPNRYMLSNRAAFAVPAQVIAALSATGPSRIDGSDAVVISYPGFFETLQRLVS